MSNLYRATKQWARQVEEKLFQDFIFIHINKTAGSSIEKALGLHFEHKTALEKRAELGQNHWESRFSFAFVRNPWDRAVSQYYYRKRTNKTGLTAGGIGFLEWLQRVYGDQDPKYYNNPRMFMPQWKWISDEEGKPIIDFIGRFETLAADIEVVCRRLGREATLPHLKRSKRGNYREYYDEAGRKLVERRFKLDIEHFGYEY